MTPRARAFVDAGTRSRELYFDQHGHYPEERAAKVRDQRLIIWTTRNELDRIEAAASEAGISIEAHVRAALGLPV